MSAESKIITLPSGLRVLHCHRPASTVEYLGVVVDAGSRDDPANADGLSHFVEHTLFKGTTRRRSWHIINRMESIGGELNAYTTKESTTIYSVFPAGNLDRAADLIADLVIDSQFPSREIDRERDVVADEINSYLDQPSEAVYDDFEDLLFAGSGLGHNILGNVQALNGFDSTICRDYLRRLYRAENMVVFYSGPCKSNRLLSKIQRYFSDLPSGTGEHERLSPQIQPLFSETKNIDIHQAHTIVGARVCDMFDPRRHAFSLIVNMLGGPGMNSLLNVEMRERRGLVYSVDAFSTLMTDCGVFAIYFGCDRADVSRCRRIIDREILRIADGSISEQRLAAAKRQFLGQMDVASSNPENSILSLARTALYRGEILDRNAIRDRYASISSDEIRLAAQMILPDRLSSLTLM